ncbi:MAG TPA: oligosaccharide flippase family protein [Smithellaceae bacterium]|nr:oligosaccharide flippase family protein [Smithellaceae bacterium]HQI25547.1 oligosaccharide flippase family protein [Smithella sp.]HRS90397.1 oligosaccharide flippase family protein [Smithellaceae bacterium]
MFTRQITISWLLNYLNMGWGFIFTLFLTPFIIRELGQNEFGIYSLIGSFAAYLHLLEFGMGAAVVRYVAKYNAENDERGRENFLAMILYIHIIVAVLILMTGFFLTTQLDKIFAASLTNSADIQKAVTMMTILTASFAFCAISNVFVGVLNGHEQFIFPRLVSSVSWIGRILATIFILIQIPTAVAITVVTAGFAVFAGAVNAYYAIRRYKVRIKLHTWKISLLREVLSFSFYNFLLQIMGLLYWNIGIMIVGMRMSAAAAGIYAIGIQLNLFALQFSASIVDMFLPHATKMMVNDASDEETTIFAVRLGRIILMLYGGICLGFLFLGKSFIRLWAGEGYESAYYVTLIALAAAAIPRMQSGMSNVLKAKNLQRVPALAYAASAALAVPISWMLAESYGLIGIISGAGAGLIIGNVIIANIYFKKYVGIDLRLFFSRLFAGAPMVVLCTALTGCAANFIPGISVKIFLLQCLIFTIVYVLAVFIFGLTHEERTAVNGFLK